MSTPAEALPEKISLLWIRGVRSQLNGLSCAQPSTLIFTALRADAS